MKWCIVLMAGYCVAASAQVPQQNVDSKLKPYQLQALENALRSPKTPVANSFSGPFAQLPPGTGPLPLAPKPLMPRELAKACAIPLLSVKGDPKIDPGIQRKLGAEAFYSDHMPVAKGLPPCPQDRQPAQ